MFGHAMDIGDARRNRRALVGISDSEPSPGLAAALDGRRVSTITDLTWEEGATMSPDGKMVAFVAIVGGTCQIWIRLLAGGAALGDS
jgi:hypothetical protein